MQNDAQTTPETAKLKRKEYEKELHKLQIELCKLQEWVRYQGRCGSAGGARTAKFARVSARMAAA